MRSKGRDLPPDTMPTNSTSFAVVMPESSTLCPLYAEFLERIKDARYCLWSSTARFSDSSLDLRTSRGSRYQDVNAMYTMVNAQMTMPTPKNSNRSIFCLAS